MTRCVGLSLLLAGCTADEEATDEGAEIGTTDTGGVGSSGAGESGSEGSGDSGSMVDSGSTGGGDSESGSSDSGVDLEPVTIELFSEIVFYDGYAGTVDEPVPDGVIRHSNALYAVKLSEQHLDSIQGTLSMQVTIGALCDNYDRLGSVQLALVPKGSDTYVPSEVDRYEIARFITPFMDMNRQPDRVPFEYELNDVAPILKDEALLAEFDMWIEFAVFGVPYAANDEIVGCEGRNDTQRGWVVLHTDSSQEAEQFDVLLPLAVNETFNNYGEGASDAVGTTTKTIEFTLDTDTTDTQMVLITSNHGANAGGEEYNRRDHYVYIDEEPVLMYRPGRDTCEPFRMYNTQGNGIYGASPKSDAEWQSFSNWCPGDVISTRTIELGPMLAGAHSFVIDVPDAVFAGGDGNIPLSVYLQGRQ